MISVFHLVARTLALGIFAVVCGSYFWVGCLTHWIVMIIWIWMKTELADGVTCMQRIFFGVISGFIHIFAFFNFELGKTLDRFHYIFYYGVILQQNNFLLSYCHLSLSRTFDFTDLFNRELDCCGTLVANRTGPPLVSRFCPYRADRIAYPEYHFAWNLLQYQCSFKFISAYRNLYRRNGLKFQKSKISIAI